MSQGSHIVQHLGGRRNINENKINDREETCKDPFETSMIDFIINKKDLLFEGRNNPISYIDQFCELTSADPSNELFVSIPPIEVFMNVSKNEKKIRFFEGVRLGDVMVGSVNSIEEDGLVVQLLAVQIGKIRDISDLKLMSFCSIRDIERDKRVDDVLSNFTIKDKVRGCVIKIKGEEVILSFMASSLTTELRQVKLGIITDEELPIHYSRTIEWDGQSYGELLRRAEEFENPSNTTNLFKVFGLHDNAHQLTFMQHFRKFDKDDYADQLRIRQSKRLADKYVSEGRKNVERERDVEAMQLINKGISVYPQHNDALILRAFLYLKSKSYKRAIEDLEEAFSNDQTQQNTRKSLVDAIMTFVVSLQKEKKNKESILYLKKALSIDPDNQQLIKLHKTILSRKSTGGNSTSEERHRRESGHLMRSTSRKDRKKRLKLLSDSVNLSMEDVDLSPESKRLLQMADSPIRFGPTLPPPTATKRKASSSSSSTSSSSSSSSSQGSSPISQSTSLRNTSQNQPRNGNDRKTISASDLSLKGAIKSRRISNENTRKSDSKYKIDAVVWGGKQMIDSSPKNKYTKEPTHSKVTNKPVERRVEYSKSDGKYEKKKDIISSTQCRKQLNYTTDTSPTTPKETLQDMELFLKQLKNTKKQTKLP